MRLDGAMGVHAIVHVVSACFAGFIDDIKEAAQRECRIQLKLELSVIGEDQAMAL